MINVKEYSTPVLITTLRAYNEAYRSGTPLVPDHAYDALVEELRFRMPSHPFLQEPEPEPENVFGKTAPLPERMLSTQKAYTTEEVQKWCAEVDRVSKMIGVAPLVKVMPKLDGYAAYYDGEKMYTRGDGRNGTDISHVLECMTFDMTVKGKGEIVVDSDFFKEYLADEFENTRNVIAAALKEGEKSDAVLAGLQSGHIRFEAFSNLSVSPTIKATDAPAIIDTLWTDIITNCPYDTDGLVFEALDDAVKDEMGATNHHHRWQMAYKRNTEFYDVRVTGLTWQTAKSGRITPVVELEPTRISGVTVSRATGHHAGNVINQGIDDGAIVRVCRSGQVIPYISEVVAEAPFGLVAHPGECPSCGAPTHLDGDNLMCTNVADCPAQVAGKIEHFFKTIGNCDGFGPVVCEQLVKYGITRVSEVYGMSSREFGTAGFGEKTAFNLYNELLNSTQREIEDWRFLAAFGIPNFGPASCEKLLQKYPIALLDELEPDDLTTVEGIGELTANSFYQQFQNLDYDGEFWELLDMFRLKHTPVCGHRTGSLAGKTICFTGTMTQGSRKDMEASAKANGATVTSSVSSKTDYLVCGENVGANKTAAAAKNGVTVLTEDEYLGMIG
jgi:DNA ligase (NAD+)